MQQRIDRLEQTVTRHDDQIAKLFQKVDDVNLHLKAIQSTLDQIKWIATGMLTYFALAEFGFLAGLKILAN
jgi:flagellar biosynthesis chaperone FliJ